MGSNVTSDPYENTKFKKIQTMLPTVQIINITVQITIYNTLDHIIFHNRTTEKF